MIRADDFITPARSRGFELYTGVPCSFLKPFINYVIDSGELHYVGAANEGDAVAIAAGSELGGKRSICMFQNSGLGNAVSPLSSLTSVFKIPVLLIVTHRGQPGAPPDEPQHKLMGRITVQMLELLGIPSEPFPVEAADVPAVLDRAEQSMRARSEPYALIMSKGSVEPWHASGAAASQPTVPAAVPPDVAPVARRTELLRAIQAGVRPDDLVVATTGYTGRELYALGDVPNQLYMVGSMGCASSFGLGLALAQPTRRVIVIDGDGAALMRLGALATLGCYRPANLVQILLDNAAHESTGGQSTATSTTDLAAVASACGYPRVERVAEPETLTDLMRTLPSGLSFVHVRMNRGVPEGLPRPSITPVAVAGRLRSHIANQTLGVETLERSQTRSNES